MNVMVSLFVYIFTNQALALEAQINFYPKRNEIIKREFRIVDNYLITRFGIFNSKTKKLKRKGYGIKLKIEEQNLECVEAITQAAVLSEDQFARFSEFIEFNNKFFKTKYGVLVEKACLKKATKEYVEKNILASYNRGLSCLKKIGSNDLLKKMNELFKDQDNPPKIFCSETEEDIKSKGITWDGAKAYASASDIYSTKDMKHPFISLGQKWDWQRNSYSFQGTLFHELIHNTGCIHTKTVEKAYTCQTCCFSETDNPNAMMSPSLNALEEKEVACKICQTDYAGISDENYIRDFSKYALLGARSNMLFQTLKTYMKESPDSNLAAEILANSDYDGKIKDTINKLIKGSSNLRENKHDFLAEMLFHYSKGDYVKAAEFLSKLKRQGAYFSEDSYKSMYKEIDRDLTFMSFTDKRISVDQGTLLPNLFKKSEPFINSPMNL